jgi:hypothetical protein
MPDFIYNTTSISKIFLGTNEVDFMYQGATEIFSNIIPLIWSFVASETTNATAITIPASAAIGDLCILYDINAGQSPTIPAGFTEIISNNNVFETSFSHKTLTSGEPGSSVSGSNGSEYSSKIMMIFRPTVPVNIIRGVLDWVGETANDPPAVTVNTSDITDAGIAIGIAKNYNATLTTTGDANWNATTVSVENTRADKARSRLYYKLQNPGALTNPTLDMTDQGSYNSLIGIYFEGVPVSKTIFNSDGSSLSGWTVSGATVDTTFGQPIPAFLATGGQYAYRDLGTSFLSKRITFMMGVIPGTTPLANFFFGADASGAGNLFRLETRTGESSGFATTNSWTSWNAPTSGPIYTPNVWLNVTITIDSQSRASYFVNGSLVASNVPVTLQGNYFAIHGDGGSVTGAGYDNIMISDL